MKDYYKGKKANNELGPGTYDLPSSIKKKPFYIGIKTPRLPRDTQPNCASYTVTT